MKKVFLFTALFLAAYAAAASDFNLQPAQSGASLQVPASIEMSFPNDRAALIFYFESRKEFLADAQKEVNTKMGAAQKAIKDFSSLAQVQNNGYFSQVFTEDRTAGAKVSGWMVRQSIVVTTDDVEGVPSLVQVAQKAGLALQSVNYSLTEESLAAAKEKMTFAVVNALGQKAQTIAKALNISPQALVYQKIEFEPSLDYVRPVGSARGALFSAARADNGTSAPVFEAGKSTLSVSIKSTLQVETVLP